MPTYAPRQEQCFTVNRLPFALRLQGHEQKQYAEHIGAEVIYCEISKEQSLLYFGLEVFCQIEAEFDAVHTYTAGPVFKCKKLRHQCWIL